MMKNDWIHSVGLRGGSNWELFTRIGCGMICCAAALLLAGCAAGEKPANSYRQVSQEEAADLMAKESDYIILDVRTQQEFSQGHIPGALCVPNETIGSGEIPELPDKEQLILVYCRSGNRSKQASEKLVKLGYTNVVEFGGITTWTGPTVSGNEG